MALERSKFRDEGNFTIRGLDKSLIDWLEARAKRAERSMSSTIRIILMQARREDLVGPDRRYDSAGH